MAVSGAYMMAMDVATAGRDAFHGRYGAWREADGSCAQTVVRDRLTGFAPDFQTVLAKAADTDRPLVARPLGERLIEAATREAQSHCTLTPEPLMIRRPGMPSQGARARQPSSGVRPGAGIGESKLDFGLPLTNRG